MEPGCARRTSNPRTQVSGYRVRRLSLQLFWTVCKIGFRTLCVAGPIQHQRPAAWLTWAGRKRHYLGCLNLDWHQGVWLETQHRLTARSLREQTWTKVLYLSKKQRNVLSIVRATSYIYPRRLGSDVQYLSSKQLSTSELNMSDFWLITCS